MTSLLLIISFLLHIILLAVVYVLYQQIQSLKENQNREMEQLISEFIHDIKEENTHLQQQLQNQSRQPTVNQPPNPIKERVVEHKEIQHEDSEVPKFEPIMPTDVEDKVETSTESLIFKLYDEGMPADDIAKKVNRGKTEVELLLKLGMKK